MDWNSNIKRGDLAIYNTDGPKGINAKQNKSEIHDFTSMWNPENKCTTTKRILKCKGQRWLPEGRWVGDGQKRRRGSRVTNLLSQVRDEKYSRRSANNPNSISGLRLRVWFVFTPWPASGLHAPWRRGVLTGMRSLILTDRPLSKAQKPPLQGTRTDLWCTAGMAWDNYPWPDHHAPHTIQAAD